MRGAHSDKACSSPGASRHPLPMGEGRKMRTICEGKHLLLLDNDDWEYVERKKGKEAVAIVAVTDDDRVILTEQFRKPVNARVIDWPAGLVGDEDENSTPEETARKELIEEAGYDCESVELVARGPSSPGITSE